MSSKGSWKSPDGKTKKRERGRPNPLTPTTPTTSSRFGETPTKVTKFSGEMRQSSTARKRLDFSGEAFGHGAKSAPKGFQQREPYQSSELMPPDSKYPWKLIRHLKKKLEINCRERTSQYIFKVFQGWKLLYDWETLQDCLCGKKGITYVSYLIRKEDQHTQIGVGNKCVGLFQEGLSEAAESALEYLKTHPVTVQKEGPTKRGRYKFQVIDPMCWPKKHPLFEDEKVLGFLKNVFQFVFVEKKGKKCFFEAKLSNDEMEAALDDRYIHNVLVTPNIYCADFGAGINLTIEILPKYHI